MMTFKKIATAALMTTAAITASAQNNATGYFNDGYLYRHQMNPAIGNGESYFSMPFLSNLNVGIRGNVGVGDFLFYKGGKTMTLLHPDISTAEAMKPFSDSPKMSNDLRYDLFSFGMRNRKSYITFGIALRSDVGIELPSELFHLAKEGPKNQSYDLSAFNVSANAYTEVSFGYARQIDTKLNIGAKAKVLLGILNVEGKAKEAHLDLMEDKWQASVDAEVNASMQGLQYLSDESGPSDGKAIDELDFDGFGFGGYGFAFDLGATYDINDDWKVGLSLLDLGMIFWSNNMQASTNGRNTFSTDAYMISLDGDAANSVDNQIEQMGEDLKKLYQLKNMGDKGSRSSGLGATLNASAQYTIPSFTQFTAGALLTSRFNGDFSWTDFRLSGNYAPSNWFAMSASFGVGTFGPSFGWLLNLHAQHFNLYAGMDCVGVYDKNFVPMSNYSHFNVGLNFPLK